MKSNFNFYHVLTVIFIILKAMDIIDWSWWWVLSPFWVREVASAIIAFVAGFVSTK